MPLIGFQRVQFFSDVLLETVHIDIVYPLALLLVIVLQLCMVLVLQRFLQRMV